LAAPLSAGPDDETLDLGPAGHGAGSRHPDETLTFGGQEEEAAQRHGDAVVLRPGSLVRVRYLRTLEDLGRTGDITRIEMGYQLDEDTPASALVADGQRTREGLLLRREPVVRVPAEPKHELQVWFRIDLANGHVVWDSQFARNYRFAVGR
jgi:hypothetical protein